MTRAQIGKMTSRKTRDSKILVVEKGNSNNSDGDSDWEDKCGVSRDFCCPHTNHCEYFCRRLPYMGKNLHNWARPEELSDRSGNSGSS